MNKYLIILCIFIIGCGQAYQNADVYVKTRDGKEYSCISCDIYISEDIYWEDDDLELVTYSADYKIKEKITIQKAKINVLNINLGPGKRTNK